MVKTNIYQCNLCNLITHLKTDFNRHKRTYKHKKNIENYKKMCLKKKSEPKMNPNEPKPGLGEPKMNPNEPKMGRGGMDLDENKTKKNIIHKCIFCDRIYSTNSHMNRHMKSCKYRDKYDINNPKGLVSYIKKMEKEQQLLKEKVENIIINNTITNNTINMHQNIYINNYGKENLDYLTQNYLLGLVYKPYNSVQCLVKNIYFHPNHPENHNIRIPNRKEKFATVYNSGNWELRNKREVIENIVDNSYNIIDCYYDETKDKLEGIKKNRFSDFQKQYNNDPKIKKNIENENEIIILNQVL